MAFANKAGIEKLVYQATAGPIELLAQNMGTDFEAVIEKITANTARGTLRRTGNKMVDFTFNYYDSSILSDLEADENNVNDLEIWQLGSASADGTIPDVELIAQERIVGDPESE